MKSEPTTLSSERLRFRFVRTADAPAHFALWTSDLESVRYLHWRPHQSLAETEVQFAGFEAAIGRKEKYYYVVEDRKGQAIGFASLKLEADCRALVGFVVFRDSRGRGYAHEILRTMCDWCFAQPEIYRVYGLCDTENRASIHVMEKAGMMREAVLRRWVVHPNLSPEPRDSLSYVKLKNE